MREVCLDTETTGLDPGSGHRVIEIGCIELINHVPTGERFQRYLNPERRVPADALAVHGITDAFLADKPRFAQVADELVAFLADAPLVIHNAAFDIGFLNAELARIDRPPLAASRAIDTVSLARRKFPAAPASLDALCRRFAIDLSDRTLHGALKDAELLARVYLELIGGREPGLVLVGHVTARSIEAVTVRRTPRLIPPTSEEAAAHAAFVRSLGGPSLWIIEAAEASVTGTAAGAADS
ncbi:MAG: DNA polymerase III subunit epsilon [Rhodospirillales bacterium]